MAVTILEDTLEGGAAVLPMNGSLQRAGMYASIIKVTFDSSYPTGGEAVDFTNYGFSSVVGAVCLPGALTYYGVYDVANSKFVVYARATDSEVSNATDLSALSLWFFVLGFK